MDILYATSFQNEEGVPEGVTVETLSLNGKAEAGVTGLTVSGTYYGNSEHYIAVTSKVDIDKRYACYSFRVVDFNQPDNSPRPNTLRLFGAVLTRAYGSNYLVMVSQDLDTGKVVLYKNGRIAATAEPGVDLNSIRYEVIQHVDSLNLVITDLIIVQDDSPILLQGTLQDLELTGIANNWLLSGDSVQDLNRAGVEKFPDAVAVDQTSVMTVGINQTEQLPLLVTTRVYGTPDFKLKLDTEDISVEKVLSPEPETFYDILPSVNELTIGRSTYQHMQARYVRFSNMYPAMAGIYISIVECEILDTLSGTNYCLQEGVTATSDGGEYKVTVPHQLLRQAIDGYVDILPQHRWSTSIGVAWEGDGIYFEIDLTQVCSFNKISLYTLIDFGQQPKSLNVQLSDDGVTWTTVGEYPNVQYVDSTYPGVSVWTMPPP